MLDLRADLAKRISAAIQSAQEGGDLPRFDPPEIVVERPREAGHGDFATPVCLGLARLARMAPLKIAEIIVRRMEHPDYLGEVQIAPPGFINFILSDRWLARQVDAILEAGATYANSDLGQGLKVQVEFVSANPTGPLHVGSGRNAAIGDALANILEAVGYEVQREYYVNDAGTQIDLFAATLYARYSQALGVDEPLPEGGYQGAYMREMGERLAAEHGSKFLEMDRQEALAHFRDLGLEMMLERIREDLEVMGVRYDCWFSERTLYKDGYFDRAMDLLRQGGYLEERDGAVWFKAKDLGADKDEVVVRSSGLPGYFASDIAYHYEKFLVRGFDRVIDVWGADHQGQVPRLKAAVQALGVDPERLILILYQLVTLKRGGEVLRLSKRTGDMITLREVLDEVGPDATRFFLLARAADSQMDFDLQLAVEQSNENPVYYVQYAHARIASILQYAGDIDWSDGDVSLLTHPRELALIRQMILLPEIVRLAAEKLEPHHLPHYAQDLASAFHSFYRDCRVVSSDPADAAITKARLKLVQAAKIILARTLNLMGMTAPESM